MTAFTHKLSCHVLFKLFQNQFQLFRNLLRFFVCLKYDIFCKITHEMNMQSSGRWVVTQSKIKRNINFDVFICNVTLSNYTHTHYCVYACSLLPSVQSLLQLIFPIFIVSSFIMNQIFY